MSKATAPSEPISDAADGQGEPKVPDTASRDAPWCDLFVVKHDDGMRFVGNLFYGGGLGEPRGTLDVQ